MLLCCTVLASAQYQLSNSGFETYVSDNVHSGAGIRPTDWNASNVMQFGMQMTVLTDDANGHTGHCAHLKNVTVIGQTSPAWISLGTPWAHVESLAKVNEATAGTDGGIAWTHRPDSVEVWIKRTNNDWEEAFLVYYSWTGQARGDRYKGKDGNCASTTHYDEESDVRAAFNGNDCGTTVLANQVAEGLWRSNTAYNNWTKITFPIKYISNDLPEKMNIILSAGNYPNKRATNVHEGSNLWVDDLRLIYSSKAHELLINNRKMNGFNPDTYTYSYTVSATTTSVPTIQPKRSGRNLDPSEYSINYGAIGDTTTITIFAEDGSSQTTYKIFFTHQLSTNSRLADISVNGTSVTGFNPLIFTYNVAMPFGTTAYPNITYELGEDGQTVSIDTTQTFPGTALVTCTAADPSYSTTYSINFSVAPLTDNTLTDIQVNGRTINGFKPTRNSYVVELPTGTTSDPVITYTTAYPNDHDIVLTNNGIDGGATISVTPKGTTNTRTYSLSFIITASTYAYLDDIKLNGTTIENFDPETLSYYDTLPIGTTQLPTVTWTQGDEYQTVTYQQAVDLDGTAKITVTAQAGNTVIYRIYFTTLKSTNTALNAIMLDGIVIDGFDPNTLSYNVALPLGSTDVPEITWLPGDEYQTITLQDGGLTSASRIVVRAGDGTTRTYTISFTTTQSSNSYLTSLMLDNQQIEGWNPQVTEYSIVLPQGTTTIPTITWTAGDQFQTIRKVEGGVNGDTRITVKAQNGSSTAYIIHFSVLTNSCTYLNSIMIGGTQLANFHRDTLSYNDTLPGGTTVLPSITYIKGDESQTVAVNRGGINGTTTIIVRAEDGSSRTYSINFTVTKSANAFLQNILVDSVAIAGFDPEVLNYDYEIEATATTCPHITAVKNEGQNVTITVPNVVGIVRIAVTPEVGDQNIYTINIHYPQSSVTALSGIKVDGIPLTGFNPAQRNYTCPLTSVALPTVEGIAGDPLQTVHTNTDLATLTSYIYTKAESGDTAIYSVTFVRGASTISSLSDLKVDGTTINGFNPSVFNYSFTLNQGSQTAPAITFSLTDPLASAVMTAPALDGTAAIVVTAADGITQSTYTVALGFVKSSDATLSAVTRNGVAIPMELFVNDTAFITLNHNEAAPTIGYTRGNNRQMVMLASAGLQGTDIVVYAEDSTIRHYSVRYNIIPSSNSKLQSLNIVGFSPDILSYNIVLPWRTRIQPIIEPTPAEDGQTVVVNYGGINGATTIVVTAADGVSQTVYTLNYSVKKSSINYLENIYYNGNSVASFDYDKLNYTIVLPQGTTEIPKLTWDLAYAPDGSDVTEESVRYIERPLNDTSLLIVTAEDGSSRTYSVNYVIQESGIDNLLSNIMVNGAPLDGFSPNKLDYNVYLPTGTTTIPTFSYIKMFNEQSVEVVSDGADGITRIIVYSNRNTNDTTIYTINCEVSTISSARLTSVTIDGENFARFNPAQTSYIVKVDGKPEIEYTATDGCSATTIVDTDKKMAVEVTDGVNTEIYSFHFYYQNDVIPNQDFSRWEDARYQGRKPTGWKTPGDVADCYEWTFMRLITLVSCPGGEAESEGDTTIILRTTRYGGPENAIHGSIPGMITTGTMSMSFASSGNSTSSVGGSIPFRNTPQQLYVEYQPVSKQSVDNWRMWVNMFDGSTSKQSLFTGNFNNLGMWQSVSLPINYTGINNVSAMNICLNACNTENAKSLGGGTNFQSEIKFRHLHFIYNSALSAISVDGEPVSDFSPSTYDYTVTLPAEYPGRPKITMTGEVDDQEHSVSWGIGTNGEQVATIRSVGEDGEQSTEYRIHFDRAHSTNNTLQSIAFNGTPLSDFNPNTTMYNMLLADGEINLPDLTIVKGSVHANATITRNDNGYSIDVMAEDSTVRTYTVIFAKEGHSDSRLESLTIAGHPEVVFNPDTKNYSYTLAADEITPAINFTRKYSEQCIDVTDSLIVVTAGDGSESRYRFNITRTPVAPAAALTTITIDGENVPGFSPATLNYNFDITGRPSYSYSFGGYNSADNLVAKSTDDSIIINVSNTKYCVNLTRTKSTDDHLSFIRQDGSSIAGFNENLYEYNINIPFDEFPQFTTRTTDNDASLSLVAAEGGYDVIATAADGTTTHTTNLRFAPKPDTTNTLSGIYINGVMLSRSGAGYVANSPFRANITEYDITLLGIEPKLVQPQMPVISAVPTSRDASVSIELGTTTTPTVITVTSANGTENYYTLNMQVEQSSNTMLNDLAVNYRTLADFLPSVTSYIYRKLPDEEPIITYTPGDAFQNVVVNSYASHAEIIVTAESGATRTYSISFEISASSDAHINNILIDGEPIADFNPNIEDYNVVLPIGSTNAPTVTVVAGDDSQSITINEGGIDAPTSIVVTAGNGSTTRFYTVTFDVTRSDVDTLSMIYINGQEISDFSGSQQNYSFNLPHGSTVLPFVSYDLGDEYQSASLSSDSVNLVSSISVTAQNGSSRTYLITFNIQESHNAQLQHIFVDGDSLAGFSPDEYVYNVNLAVGTTRIPELTWIESDAYQQVTYQPATSPDGSASLIVLAGDGFSTHTYTVQFHRLRSSNALLNSISFNGSEKADFDPNTFIYYDTLATMPTIEFMPGDAYQTFDTIQGSLDRVAHSITVHAEDGTTHTYTFNIAKLRSANAFLQSISVNGTVIQNFDSEQFYYSVEVPYGQTALPTVSYTPAEPGLQIVSPLFAATMADTTYIEVIAENGLTSNLYKVSYHSGLSDNADLAYINLYGEKISKYSPYYLCDNNFAADNYEYNIVLPEGTDSLPLIEFATAVPDVHSAVLTVDSIAMKASIKVISQDQLTINEYELNFSVTPSSNALLLDISQTDGMLVGFDPEIFDYQITYPQGTDTASLPKVEDITYVIGNPGQTVLVTQNIPTEIVVSVIAENGISSSAYVISYLIEQSDNSLLKDIIVNGRSIKNFVPEKKDYEYILMAGDTVPSLIAVPSDSLTQIIDITMGFAQDTSYIYVTAEDGSESVYSIYFPYSKTDVTQKPWEDEVSLLPLGDGLFRASSVRRGVILSIYDLNGHLITSMFVDLVDPNDDIHDPHHAGGTEFYLPKTNQCYIYTFWYNKTRIHSGKLIR